MGPIWMELKFYAEFENLVLSFKRLGKGVWPYYGSRSHESIDVLKSSGRSMFTLVFRAERPRIDQLDPGGKIRRYTICSTVFVHIDWWNSLWDYLCPNCGPSFLRLPNLWSSSLPIKSVFQLVWLCLLTNNNPELCSAIKGQSHGFTFLPWVAMDTCSLATAWNASIFLSLGPSYLDEYDFGNFFKWLYTQLKWRTSDKVIISRSNQCNPGVMPNPNVLHAKVPRTSLSWNFPASLFVNMRWILFLHLNTYSLLYYKSKWRISLIRY